MSGFKTFAEAGYSPSGPVRKTAKRATPRKRSAPKPASKPVARRPVAAVAPPPLAPMPQADASADDTLRDGISKLLRVAKTAGYAEVAKALDHALNLHMAGDSPYRLVDAEVPR